MIGVHQYKLINKLIKKNKLSFDIIHSHFVWPSGYVGAKIKQTHKKPLLITAHGYDIYDLPFRNSFWKKKIVFALKKADKIITVSKNNRIFKINYLFKVLLYRKLQLYL